MLPDDTAPVRCELIGRLERKNKGDVFEDPLDAEGREKTTDKKGGKDKKDKSEKTEAEKWKQQHIQLAEKRSSFDLFWELGIITL